MEKFNNKFLQFIVKRRQHTSSLPDYKRIKNNARNHTCMSLLSQLVDVPVPVPMPKHLVPNIMNFPGQPLNCGPYKSCGLDVLLFFL